MIFFALQNFSGKIWSLEFTASSSKSLEGFRKGLRKGSNRKGIEKQISQVEPPIFQTPEIQLLYLGECKHSLLF